MSGDEQVEIMPIGPLEPTALTPRLMACKGLMYPGDTKPLGQVLDLSVSKRESTPRSQLPFSGQADSAIRPLQVLSTWFK